MGNLDEKGRIFVISFFVFFWVLAQLHALTEFAFGHVGYVRYYAGTTIIAILAGIAMVALSDSISFEATEGGIEESPYFIIFPFYCVYSFIFSSVFALFEAIMETGVSFYEPIFYISILSLFAAVATAAREMKAGQKRRGG